MARRLTLQGKAILTMAAVFAVWWTLPVFLKSFARASFFEFQAPSWIALSYLEDLQDFWGKRTRSENELIAAGVELARLNSAYEVRNQQARAWEAEIRRLENLLDLPRLPEHRYEVARVVRRDLTAWWQRLTIRKGKVHGLQPGQAVIYRGGVVGKIAEVHLYTAEIELLTSPRFRVAAHFEDDLRPILFQGGDNQPLSAPRGLLSNAPPDLRPEPGRALRVVTSRLGGVFPDGLTLGYVDQLELARDGLFQTGTVRLDPRLLELREVAVLVPLTGPSEGAAP